MSKREMRIRFKRSATHAFVAITDRCSGKVNRHTLYKIALDGDKRAKITGREMTVPDITRLVAIEVIADNRKKRAELRRSRCRSPGAGRCSIPSPLGKMRQP